ncbi:MAG: addiction module protein [Bacteroidetes bacterium]|nr:addiction module protein [Bacteroidota bacterium]
METLDVKINLNLKQLTSIVKQLSPSDKLKINEAIWDEKMEIPEEHKKLVMERVKKSRQNPSRMLDWEKAAKTLRP